MTYGYAASKDDLQSRLRKVQGQVRGLQRMIEEDAYCIDILTQVNSATAALRAVGMGLLDGHVRHCVAESRPTGTATRCTREAIAVQRRRFLVKAGGVLAAAGAAAVVDAPSVIAQPKVQWRMSTAWPPALDICRARPSGWRRSSRR